MKNCTPWSHKPKEKHPILVSGQVFSHTARKTNPVTLPSHPRASNCALSRQAPQYTPRLRPPFLSPSYLKPSGLLLLYVLSMSPRIKCYQPTTVCSASGQHIHAGGAVQAYAGAKIPWATTVSPGTKSHASCPSDTASRPATPATQNPLGDRETSGRAGSVDRVFA